VKLFVLDTDTVTLLQRRHAVVMARVAAARQRDEVAVTAVTIDETYAGCHSRIRRAKKDEEVVDAYAGLAQSAGLFGAFSILPFSLPALGRFKTLVRMKLNVGKNDLRIAAITVEAGGIIVTRNVRDFERIPGLAREDWSV
jgi:tRNA(fMet)-specific endonuclease VapC